MPPGKEDPIEERVDYLEDRMEVHDRDLTARLDARKLVSTTVIVVFVSAFVTGAIALIVAGFLGKLGGTP